MTELTKSQAKYHPTMPCLVCGQTRRIQCRGRCSRCYMELRQKEVKGYKEMRKAVQKRWKRSEVKYIDPLEAVQILARCFERNHVSIDQLCAYIAESRARNKRDGDAPDTHHRSWTRAWKRRESDAKNHRSHTG